MLLHFVLPFCKPLDYIKYNLLNMHWASIETLSRQKKRLLGKIKCVTICDCQMIFIKKICVFIFTYL